MDGHNGSLGAVLPTGSRGKAPGRGKAPSRGKAPGPGQSSLKPTTFYWYDHIFCIYIQL